MREVKRGRKREKKNKTWVKMKKSKEDKRGEDARENI